MMYDIFKTANEHIEALEETKSKLEDIITHNVILGRPENYNYQSLLTMINIALALEDKIKFYAVMDRSDMVAQHTKKLERIMKISKVITQHILYEMGP